MKTDIDIDFADKDSALLHFDHVAASMMRDGVRQRHPSGVYFQDVPVDPFNGLSSISYEEAGELGYFKVDFLNNTLYDGVRDESHLIDLMNREPDWGMLDHRPLVEMLAHIHSHFGIVQQIKPTSVDDLAVVLALMRPGKRHLLGKSRNEIDAEVWSVSDGYSFKRAHAIAYAVAIVVQMNLICEEMASEMEEEEELIQFI